MAWFVVIECLRLLIEKIFNPTEDDFYAQNTLPKQLSQIYRRIISNDVNAR